jgi:plasmid stability protein
MNRRQYEQPVQLTVRGVPTLVKKQLLMRATREQKSLNTVLVEILTNAAGVEPGIAIYRDLSDLAGTWVEDVAFDAAIEAQDQIDPSLWQ